MTERHYVGLYWGDREATVESCADQTQAALALVTAASEILSRWHVMRATREDSLAAGLDGADRAERLRTAFSEGSTEDVSYGRSVTLWNGLDGGLSARVEISAGARMDLEHCPAPNSCVVQLPRAHEDPAVAALLRREPLAHLLGELARCWDADWGIVSTDQYLLGVPSSRPAHHPRVGWVTFLGASRGSVPRRFPGRVQVVGPVGTIVSTRDDSFTSNDGAALDRVRAIEDALDAAGMLAPTGQFAPAPGPLEAPQTETNGALYDAALEAAVAVDAVTVRIPARRSDLGQSLFRAATALALAAAVDSDIGRAVAELRAIIDLAVRLVPLDEEGGEIRRAREAIRRVSELATNAPA